MEGFRSKSCVNWGLQEGIHGSLPHAPGLRDFRCYSASFGSVQQTQMPTESKFKKGKSYSFNCWSLDDPELQRKKRVASYKAYAMEGKMKGCFRKSWRWIKHRYNEVIHDC